MSDWKYTLPVRSIELADGYYLVGEASGTEPDLNGTAMSDMAISDFRNQIVERVACGDPMPFKDNHNRSQSVLSDLGWVMDAEVTRDAHLKVLVRLDDSNPAAQFVHSKVNEGRQYGMSIKGGGTEGKIDKGPMGNRIIRFDKVVLSEISLTSRPSWVPSFGTVLARSLDGAAEEEMADTQNDAAPVVEETPAPVEAAPTEVARTEEQATPEQETAVEVPVAEVENARIASGDRERLAAAIKTVAAIAGLDLAALAAADEPEKETSTPENTVPEGKVENSDEGESELVDFNGIKVERSVSDAIAAYVTAQVTERDAEIERSRTAIAEKDAYIAELENMPAGRVPARVVREKFDALSEVERMAPAERLSWALGQIYP